MAEGRQARDTVPARDLPPMPAADADSRRRQERAIAVMAILGTAMLALVIVALTARQHAASAGPTAERPADRQTVGAGAGGGGGAGGDAAGGTGVPSAAGAVAASQAPAPPATPEPAHGKPAPPTETAAPLTPPPPTFGFTVPAEEPKAPPPVEVAPKPTAAPVPPSTGAGTTAPTTDGGNGGGAGNGGSPAGSGGGQGGGDGTGAGAGNGEGTGAQPDPQFMGLRANGRHVVYVIDRSGSMLGGRFSDTVRQLRASIEGLPSEATFHVIFFSSPMPIPGHEKGYVMMPSKTRVRATPANKAKAISWISTVSPMGGTDPTEALREALKLKPDTIFLMTDGEFHSPDAVEALLDRENRTRKVSIFTIAFHDRSQEALLKRIAANHKGEYRFVAPGTTP